MGILVPSRTDTRYQVTNPCGTAGEAGRTRSPKFGGLPIVDVALDVARRASSGSRIELRLWGGNSGDHVWRYRVGRCGGQPSLLPVDKLDQPIAERAPK